ncbi:hypothetical protein JCM11641_002801 [Rhodosporidiobolus odoratus]
MMSRLSFSGPPPPQEPSLTSLPTRQILLPTSSSLQSIVRPQPHVAIPTVDVTPATPHLTLTGPHGGSFSTLAIDEDEFVDEKSWAYDPPANATSFIPASRRFLRPDEHPRTPALIAASGDPLASAKKRRSMICRILLVLCLVALAIGLGVGLSKGDSNKAAVQGGKGGVARASAAEDGLTTASEGGLGSKTITTPANIDTTALLTAPGTATSTASASSTDVPSTPTLAKWGGPGGSNLGGVFVRTGHHGGAALLAVPDSKKQARHFQG